MKGYGFQIEDEIHGMAAGYEAQGGVDHLRRLGNVPKMSGGIFREAFFGVGLRSAKSANASKRTMEQGMLNAHTAEGRGGSVWPGTSGRFPQPRNLFTSSGCLLVALSVSEVTRGKLPQFHDLRRKSTEALPTT